MAAYTPSSPTSSYSVSLIWYTRVQLSAPLRKVVHRLQKWSWRTWNVPLSVPPGVLAGLICSQWLFKSAYEALATPLTYLAVNFLKRADRVDHYDRGTDFNPLKLG